MAVYPTPEQHEFIVAAWREPGATAATIDRAFVLRFGFGFTKGTYYHRRPDDVPPNQPGSHRRGAGRDLDVPSGPPLTREAKANRIKVYLSGPAPLPSSEPVESLGPLTPGQHEILLRLWAVNPRRPARWIAEKFTAETNRHLDADDAVRLGPDRPPSAAELAALACRSGTPHDYTEGVVEADDEKRMEIMRRARAAGIVFPTPGNGTKYRGSNDAYDPGKNRPRIRP